MAKLWLGRALAALLTIVVAVSQTYAQGAPGSKEPLRIGVLTDMSGQFADQSGAGSVAAVKMAVEDFGGKVLGRQVEVVVADHQNRSEVAIATARQWFDVEHVDMIANLMNSSVALPIVALAKEKNRIAILNGAGSSRLTMDACTPNSIPYAYDTYALAKGTGQTLVERGGTSWFFLTADYAFGHVLEADTSAAVKAAKGEVVGSVRYPIATTDHSSLMLQAQGSKAKVVAIAGSGSVFVNAVKSAKEFGISDGGQTVAGLLVWLPDVHALGLPTAQGMILTSAFYWDRNDKTRAWSKRFLEKTGRMPHMGDAGDYSSTMHYLQAVEAAGTDEAGAVMAKMKATPVNDFFAKGGVIREDGRFVDEMYVYQVKTPAESKGPWDLYKLVKTIPADQAFRPLSESTCPLVKK